MGNKHQLDAKIVTVSDGVFTKEREDLSGQEIKNHLIANNWTVVSMVTTPDGEDNVARVLIEQSENFHGLIVTTGGTGFGPRDQTPEGTLKVLERKAPGLSEAIRLVNPLGRLSRAEAGTVGEALIINLPGSTKGSIECLNAVIDVLGHAVSLQRDNKDPHPDNGQ